MLGSGIPFSHVLLNSPQTGYLKQKFQSKMLDGKKDVHFRIN